MFQDRFPLSSCDHFRDWRRPLAELLSQLVLPLRLVPELALGRIGCRVPEDATTPHGFNTESLASAPCLNRSVRILFRKRKVCDTAACPVSSVDWFRWTKDVCSDG